MKTFKDLPSLSNYLSKYNLNVAITSFLQNMSKMNVESYKVHKNNKSNAKFINHQDKKLCIEITYKEELFGRTNTASLFIE